jgi:hypothetical protein
MDEITAPRKLTNDEVVKLRSLLKTKLKLHGPQSEEDASDLLDYAFAMIANGKGSIYVANELRSMDMEVCDGESADMIGVTLAEFLGDLTKNAEGGGGGGGSGGGGPGQGGGGDRAKTSIAPPPAAW